MLMIFMPRWLRPQSYNGLLIALLVLVVAQPVVQQMGLGERLIEALLVVVVLSGIYEVASERRHLHLAMIVGAPAVIGRILSAAWDSPPRWVIVAIFVSTVLFFVLVIVSMLRDILGTSKVSSDTLRGAIAVYLLLGVTWAMAYRFIAVLDPAAFSMADHLTAQAQDLSLYLYFSFVTLTTLGYGDMSPIAPFAQSLAWLEAAVGQLFVAITLARLVSLHIAHKGED